MRGRGALCAVALVLGLVAGCERSEDASAQAARAFAAAIRRGDVRALVSLMDAEAVERLGAAAERAGDQVGGRRNIAPEEMLQVVGVDPTFQLASVEVVEQTDTTARVRLRGADGSEHILDLVLEGTQWKVRVPIPVGVTSAPT